MVVVGGGGWWLCSGKWSRLGLGLVLGRGDVVQGGGVRGKGAVSLSRLSSQPATRNRCPMTAGPINECPDGETR